MSEKPLKWLLAAGLFASGQPLYPNDEPSAARSGFVSLSYQYIHVDGFRATTGTLPIGTTDTFTLNLDLGYRLTDRWGLEVGIPFVRKRYRGTFPHDPRQLVPPRDAEFIDDGGYHSDFQDWRIALTYAFERGPLSIEPFVALGVPSNDYPFFAHSAVGQNLTKLDVGAALHYFPGLSDAYYRLEVSRVFVEETLGNSIDHWRVNGEVGYFFSPRLAGRVFVLVKEGDGLDFPNDFPTPRVDERWFQHDRMVRHNYINAGLGLDLAMNPKYRMDLMGLTMVHADQVHIVEYAFTVGITRRF